MIAELIGAQKRIEGWFGGMPSVILSAILLAIAAFAIYMALVNDHALAKAGAVAWLLLP